MSTSNSPAETPGFAAPAETNTVSDQTVASASSASLLTGRKSSKSTLSWSVIKQSQQVQQVIEAPRNVGSMEVGDRSRAPKRSEVRGNRSPYSSKSPRRSGNASGSGHHLTADERLEQMLLQSNREKLAGDRGRVVGSNLVGSPPQRPVSPSMAIQMNSPPRELTRALPSAPQNIPITDATSDENGRDAPGDRRNSTGRNSMLSRAISELTQKQLTSESEIHLRNLEEELFQKAHMFNQARMLIGEMRSTFEVEDQGCIRRIEMLETQRNEYAMGLMEMGNRTEVVLQEKYLEYNEEISKDPKHT